MNRSITTGGANGVFERFSNCNVFATNPIILFFESTNISSLVLCLQEETMEKQNKGLSLFFFGEETKLRKEKAKRLKTFFCVHRI